MSRAVLYVAAPLRPNEEEIAKVVATLAVAGQTSVDHVLTAMQRNIDRAMRWLAWLRKSFPETTFIAPWIASILSGDDDADPALREAGILDDCAVIERCDGIVLVGPRISEGMQREVEHGEANSRSGPSYFMVYSLGMNLPPLGSPPEFADGRKAPFHDWACAVMDE